MVDYLGHSLHKDLAVTAKVLTKEEKRAQFLSKKHSIQKRNPENFYEYAELPTWVRTATAMVTLGGYTQTEAAKRCGKGQGTLSAYMRTSPAVKVWIEELKEASLDPQFMAEVAFKASAYGISLEYLAVYEKAIEASDFNAAAKISQDMLDRAGVTKKREKPDAGQLQVTLNIAGGGGIDIPQITASYEEVQDTDDDDYETVED